MTTRPLILPLSECTDPALVGGKAVGLSRLLAAGFPVPPGICVTTEAYLGSLQINGFSAMDEWRRLSGLAAEQRKAVLSDCQSRLRRADVSHLAETWNASLAVLNVPQTQKWAVRSSATNEDAAEASLAGLYRTHLGVAFDDVPAALTDLWGSLWEERVLQYLLQRGLGETPPAMAVVIQPMLEAKTAGVAYSIHPVTGRSSQVTINAVYGLAAPLVEGQAVPDQYVVEMGDGHHPGIRRRLIADKPARVTVAEQGVHTEPVEEAIRYTSSLSDDQLDELARMTKQIERAFGYPVDIEWVFDATRLWVMQARPITAARRSSELTNDDCEWTRANFKETMPEMPSPIGLSFLQYFMDVHILAHYRRLGCRIPSGLSSVRILHGRPYLNATLFYSLVGQLGGDPSLNAEQMGGVQLLWPPAVRRIGRAALVRAGCLMIRELRRCEKYGPAWFDVMKTQASCYHPDRIRHFTKEQIADHLDGLGQWLDRHEVTFGIAAGVGQCLQAFSQRLPRWLGGDWRTLFNAALQGQGTVISARQIVDLSALVEAAKRESAVHQWLSSDPWNPMDFRMALNGTEFLHAFEDYLRAYGHRAVGESDVMSPRMAEQPDSILQVIRAQLAAATTAPSDLLSRQARCRQDALVEIRRRLAWRWDRRAMFVWWYRRLARFFALREANRHHLMYYSTAVRHLLLRLGELLVKEERLDCAEDMFFVTLEERSALLVAEQKDFKMLIAGRRAAWTRDAAVQVPDTIHDWQQAVSGFTESCAAGSNDLLRGLPISVGCVSGPVRLLRSTADWSQVRQGDILVASVIDPGMAPLFGMAGGLIVEMGGTLSHGAIIAREYGLPTIANVEQAMTKLASGQRVTLDAGAGTIVFT